MRCRQLSELSLGSPIEANSKGPSYDHHILAMLAGDACLEQAKCCSFKDCKGMCWVMGSSTRMLWLIKTCEHSSTNITSSLVSLWTTSSQMA